MKKISTDYKLDLTDVKNLISDNEYLFTHNRQVCVTSREGGDNLFDGMGKITDYRAEGYEEKDFSVINDLFVGTDIERLLNDIKEDGLAYGRVRIMNLAPRRTYSYHMDNETRLHFAIDTCDKCMLIVDDEVVRVPADGKGYIINTTLPHTAVNGGRNARIHLVIDLLYPVERVSVPHPYYIIGNEIYTSEEFDTWLVETKPPSEPTRRDYYFV